MTNTNFSNVLKILSMVDFTVQTGGKVNLLYIIQKSCISKKIAVHCHAGKGRTAVVVCAWLIYHDRMPANQTIKLFQSKRKGSLKKDKQKNFLRDFEECKYNLFLKFLHLSCQF